MMETKAIIDSQQNVLISDVLLKFYALIKKRMWIFVIVGLIGALVGWFYAKSKPVIYRSYVSFALDEGGSGGALSGAMGLAAQFGISLGGGSQDVFYGDNIIAIMKSRRIVEKTLLAVDTFDNQPSTFIEYYLNKSKSTSSKKKSGTVHFPLNQSKEKLSYVQDSVLLATYNVFAKSNISAERPDIKLNVYEVSVSSEDEEFTKKFTDKLIEQTNMFYVSIKTQKSKETLDILERRAEAIKGNLNSSIANKASAQDANLNPSFAAAQVPLIKEQANTQVYGAAYVELFKNIELARFQYLKSVPLMQIIDAANYPMQKIKMGKLNTMIVFSFLSVFIYFFGLVIFLKLRTKN